MKQIQSKNAFFPKLPFCPGILAKRNPGIGRLSILIGIAMLIVGRAGGPKGSIIGGQTKWCSISRLRTPKFRTEIKKYAVYGQAGHHRGDSDIVYRFHS